MKPHLPDVSLVAIDTTDKAHLAERAISLSLNQCSFGAVKLLTDKNLKHAVKIPKIKGLEDYSKFCIRKLSAYVDTPYCLLIQSDGYVVNGAAWTDEFYKFDWGGAPWNPSGIVGNGGASWRSKKLLDACATLETDDSEHSEDQWISVRHRQTLEAKGLKYMPRDVASRFSFEGRSYNGREWQGIPNEWNGQFCFHSWLTKLPASIPKPNIMHHSLDQGDLVYGMAAIKALGGGMVFVSADNRFPHPLPSRWARMGGEASAVDNLKPLLLAQDYIAGCSYTHGLPFSTTHDLNRFRIPWGQRTAKDYHSILRLHLDAFNLPMTNEPWLRANPVKIPGRPIVVNRTARYHNDKFPWDRLVKKHGHKMVFVGTAQEAELFQGFCPETKVPFHPTANALELAEVIAGSTLFMGNQSMALAIAHGLGKAVLVEEWVGMNANCHLERPNALYEVPKDWL